MTEIRLGDARPVRFPWRVSYTIKNHFPTIVDADDKVVAQLVNGTHADAERMVLRCNAAAEARGLEEV